jgi:hypothetical protein
VVTPQRNIITTVNGKVVSASRYADLESTISGAENWGWHVIEGEGLTADEADEVDRRIRAEEAMYIEETS